MITKFLVLLILSVFFQGESYYMVMNSDCHAYSHRLARPLKPGDRLGSSDSVTFKSATGILKLAGREGSYYIKAHLGKPVLLDVAISPSAHLPIQMGRGGSINSTRMFSAYLNNITKTGRPLLIVDSLLVEVSKTLFDRRADLSYSIEYRYGGKGIRRTVKWIKKENVCFLVIDGTALPKASRNVSLPVRFLESDAGVKPHEIASLPIFVCSSEHIGSELRILRSAMQENEIVESEILHDAAYSYLAAYYGLPDTEDFFQHILPLNYARPLN